MTVNRPSEDSSLITRLPVILATKIQQLPSEVYKAFESGLEAIVRENPDVFSQSDQRVIGVFMAVGLTTNSFISITISSIKTEVNKENDTEGDFRPGQCRFVVFTTKPEKVDHIKATSHADFMGLILDNDQVHQGVEVAFDLKPDMSAAFIHSAFVNNSAIPIVESQ